MISQYYDYANNIKNDPDNIFGEFTTKTIYNDSPRKQPLSTEMLDGLKFDRLPAIFETLFSDADSFRFVITGNVDLETLKPLVEKYIGSLPTKGTAIKLTDDGLRPVSGVVDQSISVAMTQPKVSVLYNLNGDYEYTLKNFYVAKYLSSALSNRYLTSIREEKGGTYGVGVSLGVTPLPVSSAKLYIQFDTNEQLADELCQIIVDELEAMAESGPSQEQMTKSREFMLKDFDNNLENNSAWMSNIHNFYTYGHNTPANGRAIIESITVDDVKEMMRSILDQGNVIKLMMRPESK